MIVITDFLIKSLLMNIAILSTDKIMSIPIM